MVLQQIERREGGILRGSTAEAVVDLMRNNERAYALGMPGVELCPPRAEVVLVKQVRHLNGEHAGKATLGNGGARFCWGLDDDVPWVRLGELEDLVVLTLHDAHIATVFDHVLAEFDELERAAERFEIAERHHQQFKPLLVGLEEPALIDGLVLDVRSEEHTSELQSHSDLVC